MWGFYDEEVASRLRARAAWGLIRRFTLSPEVAPQSLRCLHQKRDALQNETTTRQDEVQVSRWGVNWTKDARGPRTHSCSATAALGELAGRDALWRLSPFIRLIIC